jgi:ribosome-binding protein aMBF1 (putative translation factor)
MNCYLCLNNITGKGNNGDPVVKGDGMMYAVCDDCNKNIIIPVRKIQAKKNKPKVPKEPKTPKPKEPKVKLCDDCTELLIVKLNEVLPEEV